MLRQIRSSLAAGFLTFALAVGVGAPNALAATWHKHHATHHGRRVYPAPYWHRDYAYRYPPEWAFLNAVPPNSVRGPGYVFVPGKGILGESCDMPTSTCTNDYRDVQ